MLYLSGVFELHKAIHLGIQLEFVMPPSEETDFINCICDTAAPLSFSEVWKSIVDVDIEKAEAWSQNDRDQIMAQCAAFGVAKLNMSVKGCLQEWFVETAVQNAARVSDPKLAVVACHRVGKLLSDLTRFDLAETTLLRGISSAQTLTSAQQLGLAAEIGGVWHELGWVSHRTERFDAAKAQYTSGLEMIVRAISEAESSGELQLVHAKLLRGRGRAYIRDDPFAEVGTADRSNALKDYTACLGLMERLGQHTTVDGAKVCTNLGLCHILAGNYDEALKHFADGERVLRLQDQMMLPPNMTRLYNLGCMHIKRGGAGDGARAKQVLQQAKGIADSCNNSKMKDVIESAMAKICVV